ncbi:hypothetical protein C5S29_12725 [ANME-1 cluster archaeon GoMg3.2]|nr:hypothetical protein [ANME-1 cluster archaeon GoMg3.2]
MIGVRPEAYICEPCSDIPPNWRDTRSELGYETLSDIGTKNEEIL